MSNKAERSRSHRRLRGCRLIGRKPKWLILCAGTGSFRIFLCLEVSCIKTKSLLVNEEITVKEIRAIDADGSQLGIVSSKRALEMAEAQGLDLVMIAPNAVPPVCRIMDYGKYCFEQQKRDKEQRKNQKTVEVKEVQLSCKIEDNDINTKANHARRFLGDGNKVKVVVRFRGREMAHTEIGAQLLEKFAAILADVGVVDKPAKLEGRNMVMFLAAKPNK